MWIVYRTFPFSLFRALCHFESDLSRSVMVTTQTVQLLKSILQDFKFNMLIHPPAIHYKNEYTVNNSACCIINYSMFLCLQRMSIGLVYFSGFRIFGSKEKEI